MDRGIDGLMAHAGGWVIGFHAPQSLRDLLRRPAPTNRMVVHDAPEGFAFDRLALAPTARATIIMHAPRSQSVRRSQTVMESISPAAHPSALSTSRT